jgi:hypothetical protein
MPTDAERLDWMDAHRLSIYQADPRIQWQGYFIEIGRTIRDQVDVQIRAAAPESGPSAPLKDQT